MKNLNQNITLSFNLSFRSFWPFFLFFVYLSAIYAAQPNFFSSTNVSSLFYYTCLLIPAVLAMNLLIILGLFDLSMGAIAALAGVVMASSISMGFSTIEGIGLGIFAGIVFGLLNWILVSKCRIPVLIGTLISMGIARACALGLTKGETITGLPNVMEGFIRENWGGISIVTLLGILLVLILEFLSQKHIVFRRLYHVGSNRKLATDMGISVSKLECFAFVLAGVGAAIVGLLQSSRTLSASPHAFPDLALDCIAACIIGGASISGGSGRAVGAFLGMLMVVISRNLVVMAGVSVYWKDLAVAIILLIAVLISRFKKHND
jgi:ribose transport system permease protein